jgi:hypothetical protein
MTPGKLNHNVARSSEWSEQELEKVLGRSGDLVYGQRGQGDYAIDWDDGELHVLV